MSFARRLAYEGRARVFDLLLDRRVSPFRSASTLAVSLLLRPIRPSLSLALLCRSHQVLLLSGLTSAVSLRLHRLIESLVRRACRAGGWLDAVVAERTAPRQVDLIRWPHAGLVLKAPRGDGDRIVEKGVFLLKNTERLEAVRRLVSMTGLLRQYTLVLEPSWAGYANLELLAYATFRDHRIVVLAPCREDHAFLERLGGNLHPISIGASDWVDPRVFRPLERCEKRFDAVLVSRWAFFKRHHLLFRALRRMGDPTFRVALVAGILRRDKDGPAIKGAIEALGLTSQIEIFEKLEPEGVNEILNQSKVNLLLSRQEGSNRSLFEGFFAGVPGLAFADHVGIPKDHFTPQTGRLIAEGELADALLHFRHHWSDFDPRPWALAHIAPEVTTAKLNALLKRLAEERGEPWTRDIVAKCNRADLRYYPDSSAGDGFLTSDDLVRRFARPSVSRDSLLEPAASSL